MESFLFSIYINDVNTSVSCKLRLFADDTCLIVVDKNINDLHKKITTEITSEQAHSKGGPYIKDSLWLSLKQGPNYFSLVLYSTTSEKSFISCKVCATIYTPLRFSHIGQKVCPTGEYLWLDMLRAADES